MSATLVLKYDRQFEPLQADRSNLGVVLNDQVIQKWRHQAGYDPTYTDPRGRSAFLSVNYSFK
jgi:hypothetical protein